ncbi:MAG TPA: hypothetical protein VEH02_04390 [Pseudolabrys sp.]|nr:hypothetical protein [Pseudolabrys sp.]
MAKKRKWIHPLRDDSEYRLALAEIRRCFVREPKADTNVETLLDSLATVIEADERERDMTVRDKWIKKKDRYSSFSVVK